jgi:hypothetical protein
MKRFFFHGAMLLVALACFATTAGAQANAANPYDQVGAQHNEALARYFAAHPANDGAGGQVNEADVLGYVCAQTATPNCSVAKQVLANEYVQDAKRMPLGEAIAYLHAKGQVSNLFAAYANKLDACIGQHVGGGYDGLYRAIVDIENQIQADGGLKNNERTALLLAASVARHSGKFWLDVATGATNYPGLVNTDFSNGRLPDIIRADIRGGILGAVYGALIGLDGIFVGGLILGIAFSIAAAF